ncbi:MAG: biosynthetic-type acetolactate synthase large subunit [Clostridiales Family XIII bacterium]|nr:biosynthetic-type acetolactate synthase large subunit [Clostridiales Family XIII bacterium]
MKLTGAKIIMECLLEQGVDTIFGYPGGQIMPLYDALYDYTDDGRITHILTSHEQGATHAADGYARSTGGVGVCFATSGPGATNTVTGIATAYMDSSPIVVITGQVPLASMGRDSFQEVDIIGITLPITKHSFPIRSVEEIAASVREGFRIANSGRPGPVLIDVPKDLFVATCDYKKAEPLPRIEAPAVDKAMVKELAALINEAERPVLYAGGGVNAANASAELTKLAKKSQIPTGTTLMSLGCFDREDPLSLGMIGMHGQKDANLAVHHSDLLVSIGARFSDRVTGDTVRFAKKAKVAHIDIDRSELGKNVEPDLALYGDVKEILTELIPHVKRNKREAWNEKVDGWKRDARLTNKFEPANIIRTIYNVYGDDTIVATDVGQHQMWTAQNWPFRAPRRLITSGGLGTMGFGLGAAIGSSRANPGKRVILVTGDGSFRMNLNELLTVNAQRLPITVFVMKNRTLGMVRQWQKLFFARRYSATDLPDNLDYIALGQAMGVGATCVSSLDALREAATAARDSGEAGIIVCDIPIDENVWPIVPPGDAINNQVVKE